MPTKRIPTKKAANLQMDQLIMAILALVVVGVAVIIWQNWRMNRLSDMAVNGKSSAVSNFFQKTSLHTEKQALLKENEALKKRLVRWNENALESSPQGELLKSALVQSGYSKDDPLLWEFYVLRVGKILDDAKTPYAIMVVSDGTQDRGVFVAKRIGEKTGEKNADYYEFVPGTLHMVSNYTHQVVQSVKWAAQKSAAYEVLTLIEDGSSMVDKQTIALP